MEKTLRSQRNKGVTRASDPYPLKLKGPRKKHDYPTVAWVLSYLPYRNLGLNGMPPAVAWVYRTPTTETLA